MKHVFVLYHQSPVFANTIHFECLKIFTMLTSENLSSLIEKDVPINRKKKIKPRYPNYFRGAWAYPKIEEHM